MPLQFPQGGVVNRNRLLAVYLIVVVGGVGKQAIGHSYTAHSTNSIRLAIF